MPRITAVRMACRGQRHRTCAGKCSITAHSAAPSCPQLTKFSEKRRRRQRRAVPGGDRRQVVPGRTRDSAPAADRGCRGLWSWCRGAGNPRLPPAWSVLAALDHRQFGRAFVLSIGEAGHEATTAPASSGAWWRSPASGAWSNAGQRTGCRSGVPWAVVVVSGCWQSAVAAGVVRAGSTRSPAVRSGFRPLDR
jgi:hypothetical protein